jgi:hypothetical protein
VVRSIHAVPDRVDPLGCTPPDPPEQPEVIAEVEDPDDSAASIIVRLTYGVGGASSYQGEARMTYDPGRRVFVHRLPAVTRQAVGAQARSIGLSVVARNASDPGNPTPPVTGFILIASYCLNPSN